MVTWRVTRSCNLNCLTCPSDSRPRRYGAELTTAEGMALISDLAAFRSAPTCSSRAASRCCGRTSWNLWPTRMNGASNRRF